MYPIISNAIGAVLILQAFDDGGRIDLYYYGARYYDDRGLFLTIDPLHGRYPGWSPYAYALNNPGRFDKTNLERAKKGLAEQRTN